jgi:hypothetical protein
MRIFINIDNMKFAELVEFFLEAKKKKMSKKGIKKSDDTKQKEGAYDVDKDGKIAPWEAARSKAIAKNKKKNVSKK